MTLRALHVIDHLGFGGAPLVVRSLVERFDPARVTPMVCALRPNPHPISINAEVITLKSARWNPGSVWSLRRVCHRYHIDVIHAHLQKSIVTSLLAAGPVPLVIHEHGAVFRAGTGCLYRSLLRLLGTRANKVIANSLATREALIGRAGIPDAALVVLDNFVDEKRYLPTLYNRHQARCELGLSPEQTAIGFVGRLDHCKGADVLLDAAATLCQANPDYRVIIVGYGPEWDALQAQTRRLNLQNHVQLTGLCENPAVVMAALDVAVVPSRREAFGLAALEFMCMGVPVVAAPVGGLPALIEDKVTGMLLSALEPEQIVQAVEQLQADPVLRNTIIEKASAWARRYDGRHQVEQLTQIYEGLCHGTA
jgi:glycosyltransferase involved in cell wall biosynthesis